MPATHTRTSVYSPVGRLSIIKALILRDLLVRHGRHSLGFFWDIMEPTVLATGVMLIWSVIHESTLHGVNITTFAVTCYLPLTLSRHLIGPLARLFRANASLLFHRPVRHSDIIIARILSEFMSSTTALVMIYFVTTSIGVVESIQDWPLALAGWLFTGWFYGGVALLASAWTEYWEPAEKFVQPIQYLALPLSAAFFMVDWVPAGAQRLLLLNPAVHCYEMFRAGFFGDAVTTHYDPWYLATWSTIFTLAGAGMIYRVRDRIQLT